MDLHPILLYIVVLMDFFWENEINIYKIDI